MGRSEEVMAKERRVKREVKESETQKELQVETIEFISNLKRVRLNPEEIEHAHQLLNQFQGTPAEEKEVIAVLKGLNTQMAMMLDEMKRSQMRAQEEMRKLIKKMKNGGN